MISVLDDFINMLHCLGRVTRRVILAQQSEGRAVKKGLAFGRELGNISCTKSKQEEEKKPA